MFIQLNNHKAHIYNKNPIDSSKKSIVFLPGAGMDHRTLSMFKLSKIESEYNLIAIDLPGHGYTSGPLFSDVEEHVLNEILYFDFISSVTGQETGKHVPLNTGLLSLHCINLNTSSFL